jgi:hypothetical protein
MMLAKLRLKHQPAGISGETLLRYRLSGKGHPGFAKDPGPDLALTEIFCLVKLPHSRETIDGLVLSRQGGLDINPPRRINVKILSYEDSYTQRPIC